MKLNLPRRTKPAPVGLNQIRAIDFMADALYSGRAFRLNLID
jgi:hypothetical protein